MHIAVRAVQAGTVLGGRHDPARPVAACPVHLPSGGAQPLLGRYVHQVFSGRRTFLHPVLGPVERGVYTLSGIHPDEKQTWGQYAVSVIGFPLRVPAHIRVLLFQDKLPLNPQGFPGLSWHLA